MTSKPHATYRLRMRFIGSNDDADGTYHLKRLLKVLLRKHRFCVLEIEQEQVPITTDQEHTS
jgi:hypothetical protein